MSYFRSTLVILLTFIMVGCAHPINVEPDVARLSPSSTNRIGFKVGYHVPPEVANLEVTTPGGGGDNVRYNPYAALSSGYRTMLSNVFETVVSVATLGQVQSSPGPTVDYVMIPMVVTNSGGSNFFTWPPENFTVDLTTSIRDKEGKVVATPRVVGVATATTSERLVDHGFSGRRAFEDALRKMEIALREWSAGSKSGNSISAAGSPQTADRLNRLKDLFDRKMISEQEYQTKRKAILADL